MTAKRFLIFKETLKGFSDFKKDHFLGDGFSFSVRRFGIQSKTPSPPSLAIPTGVVFPSSKAFSKQQFDPWI